MYICVHSFFVLKYQKQKTKNESVFIFRFWFLKNQNKNKSVFVFRFWFHTTKNEKKVFSYFNFDFSKTKIEKWKCFHFSFLISQKQKTKNESVFMLSFQHSLIVIQKITMLSFVIHLKVVKVYMHSGCQINTTCTLIEDNVDGCKSLYQSKQ